MGFVVYLILICWWVSLLISVASMQILEMDLGPYDQDSYTSRQGNLWDYVQLLTFFLVFFLLVSTN